ncbi:MAG: hypothetical protein ONB05_04130 [candidate division KSB1 bacterium]|nr:hypothetical protein [candidate division KSB1 bacterium]
MQLSIEQRLTRLETRVEEMEKRLDGRINELDRRLTERMDDLNSKFNGVLAILTTIIAGIFGAVAYLVSISRRLGIIEGLLTGSEKVNTVIKTQRAKDKAFKEQQREIQELKRRVELIMNKVGIQE